MTHKKLGEGVAAQALMAASVIRGAVAFEELKATGVYTATAYGPIESMRAEYCRLRDRIARIQKWLPYVWRVAAAGSIAALAAIPVEAKWSDTAIARNLVTTPGKNDLADKYFAGSAYTAAWYIGLIDLTSYTAVAATDTMASHAGWVESSAYSQANRPTTAWAAASAGSKALSAALTYSINATVTIKGCFLTSNNTKGGTTGVLYSAGLFTGGDKALSNGDTLSVSYTASF